MDKIVSQLTTMFILLSIVLHQPVKTVLPTTSRYSCWIFSRGACKEILGRFQSRLVF